MQWRWALVGSAVVQELGGRSCPRVQLDKWLRCLVRHKSTQLLTLLSQAKTLTTPAQELQHLVAFVGVWDRLPQACRDHLCIVHGIFHPGAWWHMQSHVYGRLTDHSLNRLCGLPQTPHGHCTGARAPGIICRKAVYSCVTHLSVGGTPHRLRAGPDAPVVPVPSADTHFRNV